MVFGESVKEFSKLFTKNVRSFIAKEFNLSGHENNIALELAVSAVQLFQTGRRELKSCNRLREAVIFT